MAEPQERPLVVPTRLLYSVEEAAALLGIGRTYMFELIASGQVRSLKLGKHRRIPRSALDDFIERLANDQAPDIREDASF